MNKDGLPGVLQVTSQAVLEHLTTMGKKLGYPGFRIRKHGTVGSWDLSQEKCRELSLNPRHYFKH